MGKVWTQKTPISLNIEVLITFGMITLLLYLSG